MLSKALIFRCDSNCSIYPGEFVDPLVTRTFGFSLCWMLMSLDPYGAFLDHGMSYIFWKTQKDSLLRSFLLYLSLYLSLCVSLSLSLMRDGRTNKRTNERDMIGLLSLWSVGRLSFAIQNIKMILLNWTYWSYWTDLTCWHFYIS